MLCLFNSFQCYPGIPSTNQQALTSIPWRQPRQGKSQFPTAKAEGMALKPRYTPEGPNGV